MPFCTQEALRSRSPERRHDGRTRAAVLAGPQTVRLSELEPPRPGSGQVRVRLEGSGVCASNVPVWEGRPWFNYPLEPGAPGHEGWGAVEAVGPGVDSLAVGDRVAMLSYHAYAEHDLADASAVVKLPAELDGVPFPGEPLGCAVNVFRRSDVGPGQTVAVVGIGFLGALLVRLAKSAGARVVAVSRRPYALQSAERFGADHVIRMQDPSAVVRQINALTSDEGCERVIETTGHQEPLTLAGELVRVRGRLIVAGYHQDGMRQINMQLWNWRGIDVVNAHERDTAVYIEGIRLAVDDVLAGRLDPAPLYTHAFPLGDLATALDCARRRPDGFMKALILTS